MDDISSYLLAAGRKPASSTEQKHQDVDIEKSIFDIERKMDDLEAKISETNISQCILKHRNKQLHRFSLQIDELARRMKENIQKHNQLNNENQPTYFSRDRSVKDSGVPVLETSCSRDVRDVCETISKFTTSQQSTDPQEINQCDLTKDALLRKVEALMDKYSGREIRAALLNNAKESTHSLRDITSRISLENDAQQLKFQFESGKLKDVSEEPTTLRSVRTLIEDGEIAHFERFLAREENDNESHSLKKQLSAFNKKFHKELERFPVAKRERIKYMLNLQQEEAKVDASINQLHEQVTGYQRECEEKRRASQAIEQKHSIIKNFEKHVQAKQSLIQDLIRKNISAKDRHRQQQNSITTNTVAKILSLKKTIAKECDQLHGFFREEMEAFLQTPISTLNSLPAGPKSEDMEATRDQSIHRLDMRQTGASTLREILNTYEFPEFAASENALKYIIQAKNKDYRFGTKVNSSDLEDLCTKVEELHAMTSSSLRNKSVTCLPALNTCLKKSSDVMTHCKEFKEDARVWWEQPAQHTVPWVKEDGISLTQCLDHFQKHAQTLHRHNLVK